jgi:hypothetical protein
VLIAEVGRHPNDRGRIRAGRVRHQLTEMRVIRGRQLVLDDEDAVVREISSDQI